MLSIPASNRFSYISTSICPAFAPAITIPPVQDTSLSGFALFKAGGGKYYKVPLS
jgi:hypothetical protein